jgi:hypothetical protein
LKNYLRRLWARIFGTRTGAFDPVESDHGELYLVPAYDPSEDPEKIMMGENESYFD